jgi:hypothetical protein
MQMYIYQQHHYPFPYEYYRTQMPMMNYYQQSQINNNLKKPRERSRDSRNNVKKHNTRSNSSNSRSSSDSYNYK